MMSGAVAAEKKRADGKMSSRHLRVPFQQLAEKRQFDKIMDVLIKESSAKTLRLWLQGDLTHTTSNPGSGFYTSLLTPLHRIAAVQPPAWIIELIIQRMEGIYKNVPLDVTDVLGRTPLHVAAGYGSTDAIQILANGCSPDSLVTAPLIQDEWLRCPLHWACTHPKERAGPGDKIFSKLVCRPKTGADMIDAVRILIDAYPEATLIRDHDGKTPLDLALENGADPRIVAIVDSAAKVVRRGQLQKKRGFWDNPDDTSFSDTEEEAFPKGFPGEISVHTRSSSSFEYNRFEC